MMRKRASIRSMPVVPSLDVALIPEALRPSWPGHDADSVGVKRRYRSLRDHRLSRMPRLRPLLPLEQPHHSGIDRDGDVHPLIPGHHNSIALFAPAFRQQCQHWPVIVAPAVFRYVHVDWIRDPKAFWVRITPEELHNVASKKCYAPGIHAGRRSVDAGDPLGLLLRSLFGGQRWWAQSAFAFKSDPVASNRLPDQVRPRATAELRVQLRPKHGRGAASTAH